MERQKEGMLTGDRKKGKMKNERRHEEKKDEMVRKIVGRK